MIHHIAVGFTNPSAPQSSRGTLECTVYSRLSNAEMLSPPTVHSGHTFFSASQIFLSMSVRPGTQITEGERNPPHIDYLQPVANLGGQLAHILPVVYGQQHRLDARRQRADQLLLDTSCAWSASTHTPCRDRQRGESAPTAVTFPRSDISPVMASVGGTRRSENSDTRPTVNAMPALGPSCTITFQLQFPECAGPDAQTFGTAPAGQCTCRFLFLTRSSSGWLVKPRTYE